MTTETMIIEMVASIESSAEKMREKANQYNLNETNTLVNALLQKINERAEKGAYKGNFPVPGGYTKSTYDCVKKALESLKYTVEGDTYKGSYQRTWTISW